MRDLHRYRAMLVEPWDGPAGLVFTDGAIVRAALDRNGLRPLRVAVAGDGLVAVRLRGRRDPAAGRGARAPRHGSAPGSSSSVDPERGLRLDGELKRDLAPSPTLRRVGRRSVERRDRRRAGAAARRTTSPRGTSLFGYTREELSVMLRPIAADGHDPVYSMGDDARDRRRSRAARGRSPPTCASGSRR